VGLIDRLLTRFYTGVKPLLCTRLSHRILNSPNRSTARSYDCKYPSRLRHSKFGGNRRFVHLRRYVTVGRIGTHSSLFRHLNLMMIKLHLEASSLLKALIRPAANVCLMIVCSIVRLTLILVNILKFGVLSILLVEVVVD